MATFMLAEVADAQVLKSDPHWQLLCHRSGELSAVEFYKGRSARGFQRASLILFLDGRFEAMILRSLKIGVLHPDPDQPRRDPNEGEVQNLASSLGAEGQQVPLIVYAIENGFAIADGWRRYG